MTQTALIILVWFAKKKKKEISAVSDIVAHVKVIIKTIAFLILRRTQSGTSTRPIMLITIGFFTPCCCQVVTAAG